MTGILKGKILDTFERLVVSDRGRATLLKASSPLSATSPIELEIAPLIQPFSDLPGPLPPSDTSLRRDIVIISARFRSGSTLLWNLFRNTADVTAYYEPFNERRWFDASSRGTGVDSTHRLVQDYWREYEGLNELVDFYDEDWIRRDLYMDPQKWAPRMKRYVEILIERASGVPVLQFNRIDFRLPWFRMHFPNARMLHLFRHPRDQWCSTLGTKWETGPNTSIVDFCSRDHFYLMTWVRDLTVHFPFLSEHNAVHPYELFYFIWRVSYLFGKRFADCSIAYESLLDDPDQTLRELFAVAGLDDRDPSKLKDLIVATRRERWKEFATDSWFRAIEERCERQLADYFVSTIGSTTSRC